jgi:hypothetical protein
MAKHKLKHLLKQTFVPHRHNNYRPHLIRRYGIVAVVLVVAAVQGGFFLFQNGQILGDKSNITIAQLLDGTNFARTASGFGALKINDKLSQAAKNKAENMLEVGYWSHNAPDGTAPWHWIKSAGYDYINAGENLARGFNTTDSIMQAWLDSQSHRANILNRDYSEVGFAAVNGDMDGRKTTLIVAMYASPASVPNTGNVLAGTSVGETEQAVDFWTKLRRGLQSLTPSLIVTLILLGITTCVALLAHAYRKNLPKSLRQSWYRHHALYKIAIFIIIALSAVLSYGGGLI